MSAEIRTYLSRNSGAPLMAVIVGVSQVFGVSEAAAVELVRQYINETGVHHG